jgi:glucuronate isomerase
MGKTNSRAFVTENYLLNSKEAKILYHEYARDMPIIDYHNHSSPQ